MSTSSSLGDVVGPGRTAGEPARRARERVRRAADVALEQTVRGLADRRDQQVPVSASLAREPGDLDARRRRDGQDVALVRNLEEDLAHLVGGQRPQDRGDRGDRGLVAREEQGVAADGAGELDAAVRAGPQTVGAEQHDLGAGAGRERPAGGGARVAVQDEVNVHLTGLGADRAHGVGAQDVAALLGLGTPGGVPVVRADEVLVAAVGCGQDEP